MMELRAGLLKQRGVELSVCVVDNGDEPKTGALVNDWGQIFLSGCDKASPDQVTEPLWVYVREKIDGFGHGVNLGAGRLSTSSNLLLLNNDVRLTDPYMLLVMAHHLGPAGVGIVGARMLDKNGLINHDGVSFHNGQPMHLGRGMPTAPKRCALTPATTFACAMIDREVFNEIGGLDQGYGWGYEDTDFCLTAAEAGVATVTCRETSAVHGEFGTRERGGDVAEQHRFYGKWAVTGRGLRALDRYMRLEGGA